MQMRPLFCLGALAGLTACNPTVFGELVDNAPVRPFSINAPTNGNPYGRKGFRLDGGAGQDGSVVIVSDGIPLMSQVFVDSAGEGTSTHPELTRLQAILGPLSDFDTSTFGGVAYVPAPISADPTPHAVVSVTSTFEPWLARVVRISLSDYDRTDMADMDIVTPELGGGFVSGFGRDLWAFNLDGPQTAADYEVIVGSTAGLLIFDDVGANIPGYLATRDTILSSSPNAFSGTNEPDGYHFTLCDQLTDYIGIGAGNFGAGGSPVFVASTQGGLSLIADVGDTNAIGAPIYDCANRFIPNAGSPSETYGFELYTTDLDADGNDDLFVGDPAQNRVDVYLGTGNGLPDAPDFSIEPPIEAVDVFEFGFTVDRADLGGGFGETLLIGAPGSSADRTEGVGAVWVYRLNEMGMLDLESPILLQDQTPQRGTRHGLWAGGIRNDQNDREDIVVLGASGGRVHLAIDDLDPPNL